MSTFYRRRRRMKSSSKAAAAPCLIMRQNWFHRRRTSSFFALCRSLWNAINTKRLENIAEKQIPERQVVVLKADEQSEQKNDDNNNEKLLLHNVQSIRAPSNLSTRFSARQRVFPPRSSLLDLFPLNVQHSTSWSSSWSCPSLEDPRMALNGKKESCRISYEW